MLTTPSERLIQFKRIAVLCDLSADSEKMVRYAGSLARWYGSELLLLHAEPPQFYPGIPTEALPTRPGSSSTSRCDAQEKLRSLSDKLDLRDLAPRVFVREGGIGVLLKELEDYRPSLLSLATHGREGIRKWMSGSMAEEVFRQVQWPVLVLGPGVPESNGGPQKQFQRILYATDFSAVSLKALQYAVAIAHDHEAQLTALYVEPDAKQGFSFDRAMAIQRLHDWLQDQIDGLSGALTGVQYVVDFGKPDKKIVEAATEREVDLIILGARGLGAAPALASHFFGGTAYEVTCSSKSPVLIVPQLR